MEGEKMKAIRLIIELMKYPGDVLVEYPGEHEGDSHEITEVKYYDAEHNLGTPAIILR